MSGTNQTAKRGRPPRAVLIALALGLVACLLVAPGIAVHVWQGLFVRPAEHDVEALLAGPLPFHFVGHETTFVQNAFLDKVIGMAPESTGVMAERLRAGDLVSGHVAVLDLALWCQVTGLSRDRIPVLRSWHRPAGEKELGLVSKSWAEWDSAGRPVLSKGDIRVPDLRDYPDFAETVRRLQVPRSQW